MANLNKTLINSGLRSKACGLLVLASLLLTACASNPTGGANFVLMSERAELEKGKELHEELMQNTPIYSDPELQAYVDRIGQKMADISHRPDLDYTFTIIDSPDINAFALPGGYVYVNRGLLTYTTSEQQLAAVIGHEIAHITARHAVRQQTASRTTNILATTLVIATGVSQVGDTTSYVGGALVSGYGRDMELEADQLGAEYLLKAGYDPQAMVEVITVLKNHEDFSKKTSNRGSAYHGLFATHPRNDTRLREAVSNVGALDSSEKADVDPAVFRERMTGLPIGQTLQSANAQDRNRYYQNLLDYTMIFPQGWSRDETPTTVTASDESAAVSLKVEAQRLQKMKDPRLFVREDMNIPDLQQSQALSQFGLPGFTGINPATGARVAVIYFGPRAFIFTASTTPEAPENADELLLASIQSFRPIARNERMMANPIHIEYIQTDGRVTYADLASTSRLPQYAEDELRLMNGDYPNGEPAAGEWVKIAR